MNPTIKDAAVKRYFYETHDELRTNLLDFVDASSSRPSEASPLLSSSAKPVRHSPKDSQLAPIHKMPVLTSGGPVAVPNVVVRA